MCRHRSECRCPSFGSSEARRLLASAGQRDLQGQVLVGDLRMVAAEPAWFGIMLGSSHQMGNAVFVAGAVVAVMVCLLQVRAFHSSVAAQLEIELLEVEDRTVAAVEEMTAAEAAAAAAAEAEDETAVALLAREVLIVCLSTHIASLCRKMRVNRTGKVLALRRAIRRLISHVGSNSQLSPIQMFFLLFFRCQISRVRLTWRQRFLNI